MPLRKTLRLSLLFAIVLIVALVGQSPAAQAPQSPRDNPAYQHLLSGVVFIDPSVEQGLAAGGHPISSGESRLPGAGAWSPDVWSVPLGPNVLCNQDPGAEHQNEPSIAVNPHDPNHVIASSNDYRNRATGGDVQPGYYVSFDGGNSWPGDGVIDISVIPGVEAGGDPAMAIYDLNNVYFAYIAFHRTVDDAGGVYVSKSADGGLTWGSPVELAANTLTVFHDKEYIAVDASGGSYDGYVYVSWTRFGGGTPIVLSRSTDGGSTFSAPMQISDAGLNSNQGSVPAVGPNGEVYVAWYNYNTSGQRLAVSVDGGQTFPVRYPVASVSPIPSPLPGASFRNNSFPTIAVDQNAGNLYVAWNDYRNGDADILFVRSTDGGVAWSAPIRINDDPLGNDHHQFFPWLTVAPNGYVYAGWFDSRLDPNPYTQPFIYDEYVAVSTDDGLTFSPNTRISTVSSDASIGFSGEFIGDYSGIAATNAFVYPAWVDTRRGNQDIYTQSSLLPSAYKNAPASVYRYQPFTYTLFLSSTLLLTETHLRDPLPAEVSYLPGSLWASSGSYGQAGGVVTWTGSLSASQPVTVTFQVTPTGDCGVALTNTAVLTDATGTVYKLLDATTHIEAGPLADFAPSAWDLDLNQVVTFTNNSEGVPPLDFFWSFGDGMTSTLPSPTYTYGLPGAYTVVLTATDACGSDGHTEVLTVTCAAPTAAFTYTAQNLDVAFTNLSTGTFPLDYQWDFGDGITSTATSPLHTYALSGTYTVTLIAADLCGTGIQTDTIQVFEGPHLIYLPVILKGP